MSIGFLWIFAQYNQFDDKFCAINAIIYIGRGKNAVSCQKSFLLRPIT
jgi:hypothetical protein